MATVIIDLEEYQELANFKKNIERGLCVVYLSDPVCVGFTTNDDAVREIVKINFKLQNKINNLEADAKPYQTVISKLKEMSYWEFRKWRKS